MCLRRPEAGAEIRNAVTRYFYVGFMAALLCLFGGLSVCAETTVDVSQPISVAFPAGYDGGTVASSTISVAFPAGYDGGTVASSTISVAFPAGHDGGTVASSTISVAINSAVNELTTSMPVAIQFLPATTTDPDIVSLWHLDGDWRDSSFHSLHGTGYDAAGFTEEKVVGTQSAVLDGVGAYARFPYYELDIENNFSVVGWIKPLSAQTGGIIYSGSEGQTGWEIFFDSDQSIKYRQNWDQGEDGETVQTASGSVYLNSWSQFAVVCSDQTVSIYINGQLTATQVLNSRPLHFMSGWFELGANHTENDEFYGGLIDEVAIYQRALSTTEITDAYNRVVAGSDRPSPPTVNLASTTITSSSSFLLSGTREPGTSIWINGQEMVAYDESATDWQATVTLHYGANLFNIVSRDVNGVSSRARSLSLILDNQPPQVVSTFPADGTQTQNASSAINLKLSDQYSSLDLLASRSASGTQMVKGASELISGSWSDNGADTLTFTPANALADGTYTVTIVPTDDLGNAGSHSFSFTVDTVAPEAPTINTMGPEQPGTIILSGTKSADSQTLILTASNGTLGSLSYPTDTTWQATLIGVVEGSSEVSLHALDGAGNASPGVEQTLIIDGTAPALAITTEATTLKENSYTVEGTKEAESDLYLGNQHIDGFYNATEWSVSVTLSSEGENLYNFTVRDTAGNQSPPAQITLIRDTTGPALGSSTPTINGIVSGADQLRISFNDQWSAVDYTASLSGAELHDSAGAVIPGNWSSDGTQLLFQPDSPLVDDRYTVHLTPVDSLGNSDSIAYAFSIDQQTPSVSSLIMTPDGPHKAEAVSFNVRFDEAMDSSASPVLTLDRSGTQIIVSGDAGNDSFTAADNEPPNTELWTVAPQGLVSIQNGRLQISGAVTSINSQYLLHGDFDVEVEIDVTGASEIISWEQRLAVRFPPWPQSRRSNQHQSALQ
ncbi:LamG-like jellyroll fold domain-containing protein [uncultured Desulfuromusa sp.]|uniref:LamG-like jellyroll fold domain-containing protein n=1 Tax=uncultured Desulfuromusa sp. TaxID=219183 RepID=UPI002AA6B233|nr:LamG-like jellyroll fold domain-containing protein [uncultured Desulfuromusa sp.]